MKNYSSIKGSTTLTIGELALRLKSTSVVAETIDTAVASEFDVEVSYTYTPGYEGNTTGRWEDAEESVDSTVEIGAIRLTASTHFEGDESDVTLKRGTDITKLFSSLEIGALEDQVMAEIKNLNDD